MLEKFSVPFLIQVTILVNNHPSHRKAQINGFFLFSKLFWLIHTTKMPQTWHFVRYCGVFATAQIFAICVTIYVTFCVKNLHKWCRKTAASCGPAKTPQNLTKCHVCSVFAACLKGKNEKITKSVDHVVGINPPLGFFKYEPCLQCSQISAGFVESLCTHERYRKIYLYIYSVHCARISKKI